MSSSEENQNGQPSTRVTSLREAAAASARGATSSLRGPTRTQSRGFETAYSPPSGVQSRRPQRGSSAARMRTRGKRYRFSLALPSCCGQLGVSSRFGKIGLCSPTCKSATCGLEAPQQRGESDQARKRRLEMLPIAFSGDFGSAPSISNRELGETEPRNRQPDRRENKHAPIEQPRAGPTMTSGWPIIPRRSFCHRAYSSRIELEYGQHPPPPKLPGLGPE